MPLPPLPDNATARVWLKYTSVAIVHEFKFRLPVVASATDATVVANQVAPILLLRMSNTDSILSARYSAGGSSFSVPLTFTPVVGPSPQSTWPQDPESTMLSLTGRSFSDGRDVQWQFFTGQQTVSWPADNRYNPGDSAVIDTFRINWQNLIATGAATPAQQIVTIGGTIPSVNGYVNIRQNGYWQTKQR